MSPLYIFTGIEIILFIIVLRWFIRRHRHKEEIPEKDAVEIMVAGAILFIICMDIIARIVGFVRG